MLLGLITYFTFKYVWFFFKYSKKTKPLSLASQPRSEINHTFFLEWQPVTNQAINNLIKTYNSVILIFILGIISILKIAMLIRQIIYIDGLYKMILSIFLLETNLHSITLPAQS